MRGKKVLRLFWEGVGREEEGKGPMGVGEEGKTAAAEEVARAPLEEVKKVLLEGGARVEIRKRQTAWSALGPRTRYHPTRREGCSALDVISGGILHVHKCPRKSSS